MAEASEFLRYVGSLTIPDTLAEKLDIIRFSGCIIPAPDDLFSPHSWLALMLGRGVNPESYDALVDRVPDRALIHNMHLLKEAVAKTASTLPVHQDYINLHRGTR